MLSVYLWLARVLFWLCLTARKGGLAASAGPVGGVAQGNQPHPDEWQTRNHAKGYCAMYGICGDRIDGGALNCPYNIPAPKAEPDAERILSTVCPELWADSGGHVCCSGDQAGVMQKEMRRAEPFIIGCPACMNNFRNLFCSLFCSPDQSSFTNVTAAAMGSPDSNRTKQVTVVKEVAFYLSEGFKNATYDSCKDVSFGAANSRAMTYIGNGAHTAQEFLDFIGTVKDKTVYHIGSPIQLDFMPGDTDVPDEISPYDQGLPTCWDSLLRCSCGDCPEAPTCAPPDTGGPDASVERCTITHVLGFPLWCTDGIVLLVGLVLLGLLSCVSLKGGLEPKADSQTIALMSDASWLDARTPEREVSMGASVEEERTVVETLLPLSLPPFHDHSDTSWVSLAGRPVSPFHAWMQRFFAFLGRRVTGSPGWTILISIACVACCMLGLMGMHIETDPVDLWVPRKSRAAKDKAAFDSEFGPFYRIEQIILSTKLAEDGSRPAILSKQAIELVFDIHEVINDVRAVTFEGDVYLEDVCYKPFGDSCATQSIAQYWAMSRSEFDSNYPSLKYCLSHWSTACRSAFKAPLDPKLVLGGYSENSTDLIADATALLITLPVSNSKATLGKTEQWELRFIHAVETQVVHMVAQHGLDVSWTAQISVQRELAREALLDAPTVALSYAAMLTYVVLALGSWDFSRPWTEHVVASRALLGLAGVAVVVCSVLGGMGVCSTFGVSASLIVMEVVPFLTLAIGVDNMFLLATEESLQPRSLPVRERVTHALVAIGPSITLSTLCEALAFLTAALTNVPAVRNFALVAAAAIMLDFCLQITAFVAILVLDCERMRDGYADLLPCICLVPEESVTESEAFEVEHLSDSELPDPDILVGTGSVRAANALGSVPSGAHALLSHSLRALHEHLLSSSTGKLVVLCVALIASAAAVVSVSHVSIGLDQQVALPQDSYLQKYFSDVLQFARVGPPVYFVVENMNVSESSRDITAICGSAGCSDDSLVNTLSQAARHPAETYIATPAASWIDDFVSWVQPELPNCCRQHDEGGFCPSPDVGPCKADSDSCSDCRACLQPADLHEGRPKLPDVQRLLPWFLQATPSQSCAKGGRGVYNEAFKMNPVTAQPEGLAEGMVTSSFRAMSRPLSRQSDFIAALLSSRNLADRIQRSLDAAAGKSSRGPFVYVYSVFHPFFEQFLTIVWDSVTLLSLSVALVLLVTFAFTGSLQLSGVLALTIGSLLLDMMGAMQISGMQLNAVSLVNIAMCAGIGLEFLSHTAHAFLTATGTREQRVSIALQGKGAAVCSGIILTKFVGVAMLAFSQTKIFDLYYFRMYMALVLIGAFHGLLLLPVLLALLGPDAPVGPMLQRQSTDSGNYEQVFTTRARCIISRKGESTATSAVGDTVLS